MGNCEVVPVKEYTAEKTAGHTSSLLTEVQASQKCGTKPVKTTIDIADGYLDLSTEEGRVVAKKMTEQSGCSMVGGAIGRPVDFDNHLSHGHDFSGVAGRGVSVDLSAQLDLGNNCYGHLGKKPEKTLFPDKVIKQDFAPIPALTPYAGAVIDRVDTNRDGNMTNREITSALDGDTLNEKEKYMLKLLQKNKNSIDNDRNGISISDVKEFDEKLVQYQNELMIARKFAPELGELARTLHQRGKLADGNHDGKFSRDELTSFYVECKKEFLANPTEEGKRELNALNWGINNFDRYRLHTGRAGGGQITVDWLQTQMLREMDSEAPSQMRQNFLSQSDRLRVERYRASR